MSTDLQISRASPLRPIREIAADLGLSEAAIAPYGHFKAKSLIKIPIDPVKPVA